MDPRQIEHRQQLLTISSKLDQMLAQADDLLDGTGDWELGYWAEDLRGTIAEMVNVVDEKLEQLGP